MDGEMSMATVFKGPGMTSKRTLEEMGKALAERRKAEQARREERGRRAASGKRQPKPLAQIATVNEFTARHGDYQDAGLVAGQKHMVNRGGTPIARWKQAGLLSETQIAAINHCIRLWELVGSSGSLVANLDRTVFGCPGDGNVAEIEARDDLARIKDYFPAKYWFIFENVCRFDEPAGVAGSKLAEDDGTRRTMARTIVCMVADMISLKERLSY